jgi:hypothetical protein
MQYDLRPFIQNAQKIVHRHFLSAYNIGYPGAYARWSLDLGRPPEALGIDPYGCADAANILYTTNNFPSKLAHRRSWIATLQALQNPVSGLFREETHHPIHTTAHCVAALELFDAQPKASLHSLASLREVEPMIAFLENLPWAADPWSASHRGAGLYAALVLAGEVDDHWQQAYFDWLWQNADPDTGLFRRGFISPVNAHGVESVFPHLAGAFHYLFNLQYARQPLRYPAALVDTCLLIYAQSVYPLGESVGFAEIDWVYCLNRAVRQCAHRFKEAQEALASFAAQYIPSLTARDPQTDPGLDDLHTLFGALCCLAELQTALPGQIRTSRPLRLVLDRRPFI